MYDRGIRMQVLLLKLVGAASTWEWRLFLETLFVIWRVIESSI